MVYRASGLVDRSGQVPGGLVGRIHPNNAGAKENGTGIRVAADPQYSRATSRRARPAFRQSFDGPRPSFRDHSAKVPTMTSST